MKIKNVKLIIKNLFIISLIMNLVACNSTNVTSGNLNDNKNKDNWEPDDNKDPNEKDNKEEDKPDPEKKDYDEKWNWKNNEEEIKNFINKFQIELKDKWLELADENPILEDGKNLFTFTYNDYFFDNIKDFKNQCSENINLWNEKSSHRYFGYKGLIKKRFLNTLVNKYNWVLDIQEEGFLKQSTNILLFKNFWHRKISRKNIDNYWIDAIRFQFNFNETYSKTINGQKYYDNENILCKAKVNDDFLTLEEVKIYRYYNFGYSNLFESIDYFIKDKNYILYFKNL